ncbi:MAG TPA: NAD(P)/FAD-dependent oxidoreductase [Rubrobacteraceae bacterium]|nr:NAD(P)/FAD-dependent oxidoreductase [Rubrobacteraceae bacterium]
MTASRRGYRVVIVGAGFAGASFVRVLPRSLRRPGETLLIDREATYTYVPLIHEVAVGRLHPESVRSRIPPLCRRRCDFLQAGVTGVDLAARRLETSEGAVDYEYLVLALGSGAARPPAEMAPHFEVFWSLEDALRLRKALAGAWRAAVNRRSEREVSEGDLTVVVAGGGATGVELAAEISVLFRYLERRTPRNPSVEPRVVLLEAKDRLIGWLDPFFHEVAMEKLASLGVEVRLNTPVESADERSVRAGGVRLPARVRVWATGIEVSGLVRGLPGEHDAAGRVEVDDHLTLPGHPEVYVLGDAALYGAEFREPLLPTASVAVQQGPYAARDLARRLRPTHRNQDTARPAFDFFDRGYVVSLGPESAAAEALGLRLKGAAAQALYRGVLLYYLKSRRDRILTGADWAMERIGRLGFG